jgi:hypothetical protein
VDVSVRIIGRNLSAGHDPGLRLSAYLSRIARRWPDGPITLALLLPPIAALVELNAAFGLSSAIDMAKSQLLFVRGVDPGQIG